MTTAGPPDANSALATSIFSDFEWPWPLTFDHSFMENGCIRLETLWVMKTEELTGRNEFWGTFWKRQQTLEEGGCSRNSSEAFCRAIKVKTWATIKESPGLHLVCFIFQKCSTNKTRKISAEAEFLWNYKQKWIQMVMRINQHNQTGCFPTLRTQVLSVGPSFTQRSEQKSQKCQRKTELKRKRT